jgi:hypothetical protein
MSFWNHSNDFSKRDNAIQINSYTTVHKRDGVPHEVFAAYWRDVHGPLCSRLPGLGWYVQHHFNREQDGHLWVSADGISSLEGYVLDGMVEIGFGSASDQKRFKEASPLLFVDEQNVFEETVAYDLPKGSSTYVDRLAEATPNGVDPFDRLHVHFHALPGQEKAFTKYMTDDVAVPLAKSEDVLKLRLHLPEPHDNAQPSPPAPDVRHDVPPQRITMAMMEIAFESPLRRRQFFETDTFRSTLKHQTEVVSHVTPFGVSGVYTFVRDSQLTTAGLRGSRVAELISRLGAANQVTAEVENLFLQNAG